MTPATTDARCAVWQIGSRRLVLDPWDDQPCPQETVYAGYTRADWAASAEATWIVVRRTRGWAMTKAAVVAQDRDGVRVVGRWEHVPTGRRLGNPSTLWPTPMTCPTCGHPLTAFCPVCRGRTGGQVRSPKKTRAVRRNAKRPRKGRIT